MIYCDLFKTCGFGNLLFIISNGLSLSYDYNIPIKFIDYIAGRQDRPNFKNYKIFESLETINIQVSSLTNNNTIYIKEQQEFFYNKIILDTNKDYILSGYYQSYKYFYHNIDKIKLNLFQNIQDLVINTTNKFNTLKDNKKTILIHVRRGDYLKINDLPLIEEDHYDKALNLFFKSNNKQDYKIFLFTDDNTDDINKWNLINKYNINIFEEYHPLNIFLYMIQFDHYIIGNSSLSLIAYLYRNNKNASITHPPIWHNGYFNYDDMIPKDNLYQINNKLKNTYIINLDYRIDRKLHSIQEINKISNNPIIFNAIKNTKGAIGCTQSHISILKNAMDLNLDYVVIIEDDIKILNPDYILYCVNNIFNNLDWNVITLGCIIKSQDSIITQNKNTNIFINKVSNAQTTTGYIVNKKYYNKLYNNFKDGLENLIKTQHSGSFAIDIYWKKIQSENWYCLKHKYVYQYSNFSDIENRLVDYKSAFNIEKNNIINYFYDIPIFNILSINDMKSINPLFHNYDYIIVNINCILIPIEFIKYDINVIKNCNYDLIRLDSDINDFNTNIKNNNNLYDRFTSKPNAFLIKKTMFNDIINNLNDTNIFDNDKYNYGSVRLPLFISTKNLFYLDYYNFINFIDKIYCLHLYKDYDRLDNMLEISNAFNRNYKDFFYHGNIGLNFPSIDKLLKNNITKINLKEGEIGCNLSQQYILEDAINNNYKNILVLEDDICLSDNYFDVAYKMLKKISDLDIIQFGYSTAEQSITNYFNNIYSYNNYSLIQYNRHNNLKIKSFAGFFCTLLSQKAIKKYLNNNKPINKISDVMLADLICNDNTLNSFVITENNYKNGLIQVYNHNKSNTNLLLKNIDLELINSHLFKYLIKIKQLQFLKNQNIKINIGYTEYAYKWYKSCIDYIIKLFDNTNTTNLDYYDIFIFTDNDIITNIKLDQNCLRILIKGEPVDQYYNNYDICIGNNKQENIINIPYPFMLFSLNERRKINKKYNIKFCDKKICCFMYSIDYQHRVDIFNKFNNRIQVDSLGKSCKNTSIQDTRSIYNDKETYNDIAVEIYSKYKFVLAIENTIKSSYFTEKIINPILANSIPIYYGTEDAFQIINKERVIYFNDYDNIDSLIDYIIYLSNNEQEYYKIISKPIFNSKSNINLQNYNEFLNKKINKYLGFEPRKFLVNIKDLSNKILNNILDDNIYLNLDKYALYYLIDCIFDNENNNIIDIYKKINNDRKVINITPIESKPIESNPIESKPVESKPIESKPIESKPIESKPIESKPVVSKPIESKPVESKPIESNPIESNPIESKPIICKYRESILEKSKAKTIETKPKEMKLKEIKPKEMKLKEIKPKEMKQVETKKKEMKQVETKKKEIKPKKNIEDIIYKHREIKNRLTNTINSIIIETTPIEIKPIESKPIESKPINYIFKMNNNMVYKNHN